MQALEQSYSLEVGENKKRRIIMSSGHPGESSKNQPASPDVGVGFGDTTLLVASFVGFCALAVTVYWLLFSRVKSREEMEQEDADEDYEKRLANANVATLTRAQRRARAHFIMKQQRRAAVPAAARRENNDDNNNNNQGVAEGRLVEQQVDNQDRQPVQPQLSRKERQRAAKVAEKEQRRLFEEERRKQQKEAQELAQKERRERQRLEAKLEQEARQQMAIEKADRERQVQLEWETFLSGPDRTLSVEDWLGSLGRYADIDELAESFSTSPEAIQSRVQTLVDEGRVTGVFEGNRFICLYEDELKEIVQRIREAGSVSLSDVAGICNQVIS